MFSLESCYRIDKRAAVIGTTARQPAVFMQERRVRGDIARESDADRARIAAMRGQPG
jgi:hypothetical protein